MTFLDVANLIRKLMQRGVLFHIPALIYQLRRRFPDKFMHSFTDFAFIHWPSQSPQKNFATKRFKTICQQRYLSKHELHHTANNFLCQTQPAKIKLSFLRHFFGRCSNSKLAHQQAVGFSNIVLQKSIGFLHKWLFDASPVWNTAEQAQLYRREVFNEKAFWEEKV